MARRNIFEILNAKNSLREDIDRINQLFEGKTIQWGNKVWTIEAFADKVCWLDWKQRGKYISCEDMKSALGLQIFEEMDWCYDEEKVILYLEYLCNMIWLCDNCVEELAFCKTTEKYVYLKENVLNIMESLNCEMKVFRDDEKVIIVEKNVAATAVAEIVELDVAYEVIEYNHHLMKGDIGRKQKILKILADKVEPMRGELKKINKELESNVGYLLNKMNIRHNNVEGKNAIEYVKNLTEEELEEWYDETYQMLLLCILEYDNIERNKKVADLKLIIDQ